MAHQRRDFLSTRLPDELVAQVGGNAPREVKEIPLKWLAIFRSRPGGFSNSIARRVKVVEVSIVQNPNDPFMEEGRMVSEIDVTEDMLNADGYLAEGCCIYLIDEGSTCAVAAFKEAKGMVSTPGVSQTIDTIFHNPATLGTKLRIINTSITVGVDAMSGKTEIWDVDNHRLVASGTQQMMIPVKRNTNAFVHKPRL